MIAGKEIAQLIAARRPPSPEDSHPFKRRPVGCAPVIEQVIELWVEVTLRRIPRLQEKIIDISLVDCTDGRAGVGISGKQSTLGVGKDMHPLLQKLDAIHM